MRVLVTGSSGFVGGAIARYLHGQGHSVVGLSRRTNDLPDTVSQIQVDIAQPDSVANVVSAIGSCDAIVHAAANLSMAPLDFAVSMVNGVGTHHMLRVAQEISASSFVFISSVPVIGIPVVTPITETHPVAPRTAYHASKLYGEYLTEVARGTGVPSVILRLPAPVGPGTPPGRLLARFVAQALSGQPLVLNGKGTRRQNYVDVRDVAKAAANCVEHGVRGLYNIGGKETVTNSDLAQRCIRVLASTSPVEFSGNPDPEDEVSWEVSSQAATEAFGYEPEHTLEASIEAMA